CATLRSNEARDFFGGASVAPGLDERRFHDQAPRLRARHFQKRDSRGAIRFAVNEAEALRFEPRLSTERHQIEQRVRGVHETRATSPSERFRGAAQKRRQIAVTSALPRFALRAER